MSKRVAAYMRVSTADQAEGYSLSAQTRAIAHYVAAHGWELVETYRDEGLSARVDDIAKRPAFARMLDDAQAGRFETIIVHKLDRFARNRQVAFNVFAQLTRWRVGFVSVSESMDYSSPSGQLMLTMLVGMSQFYSDNLSHETRKGKQERKRQGIYNGLIPFGMCKGTDGLPRADTAPWACHIATRVEVIPFQGLELAFTLAAAGQSDREIAIALNARGYRTTGNRGRNPFSKDSIRVILRNRFYLGELPDGDGWIPGKHPGVIDPATFSAVEARRTGRSRQFTGVTLRRPWPLSGLGYCGLCGAPLRCRGRSADSGRSIGCGGRIQGTGCAAPGCRESDIVSAIGSLLGQMTASHNARKLAMSSWRLTKSAAIDDETRRLAIERKLVRLRDIYLDGDIGRDEYHRRRSGLHDERARLPAITVTTNEQAGELYRSLTLAAERWKDAPPDVQNVMCRALFERVTFNADRTIEVSPRPELAPFFKSIAELKFNYCGSDGDSSYDSCNVTAVVVVALPPKLARKRALDDDDAAWIERRAGYPLRNLAPLLGVSHETVRAVRKTLPDDGDPASPRARTRRRTRRESCDTRHRPNQRRPVPGRR